MSGVTGAVVGAAVIGAGATVYASNQASSAQKNAAGQAAKTQADMYNITRSDEQPYRDAGQTALNQISAGTAPGGEFNSNFTPGDLTQDPGYQFRLDQGLKGVQNSAAARGMSLSGAALKGVDQYNQGFASNEYNNAYQRWSTDLSNRFSRLSSIAGLGQAAASNTAAAGAGAANQISSAQIGAGNAAAAGDVAAANGLNSGLSSISNYYATQSYLAKLNPSAANASSYATPAPQVTYTAGTGEYIPQ